MTTLKERMEEFASETGWDVGRIAHTAGVSSSAVSQWFGKGSKLIRTIGNIEAAMNLERATGFSALWLAKGQGPKKKPAANDAIQVLPEGAIPVDTTKRRRIWVVGKGQGGLAERIWTDGDYPVGATEDWGEVASPDPLAFLVLVEGDSMYPKFEQGNFALVEPNTDPEIEDTVLVRLKTGQTMIKRLLSRRAGYRFGSFNDPAIMQFSTDDVSWIYYIAHEVPRRKIKSRNGSAL